MTSRSYRGIGTAPAAGSGYNVPTVSNASSVTQFGTDVRFNQTGGGGDNTNPNEVFKIADNSWGFVFRDVNDSYKAKFIEITFSSGTPTLGSAQDLSGTITNNEAGSVLRAKAAPDGSVVIAVMTNTSVRQCKFYRASGVSSGSLTSLTHVSALDFNLTYDNVAGMRGFFLFNVDNDRWVVSGDPASTNAGRIRAVDVTTPTLGSAGGYAHVVYSGGCPLVHQDANGKFLVYYQESQYKVVVEEWSLSGTTFTQDLERDDGYSSGGLANGSVGSSPQQGGIVTSADGTKVMALFDGYFGFNTWQGGSTAPNCNQQFWPYRSIAVGEGTSFGQGGHHTVKLKQDGDVGYFLSHRYHIGYSKEVFWTWGLDAANGLFIYGDSYLVGTRLGWSGYHGSMYGGMAIGAEGDTKVTIITSDDASTNSRINHFTVDIAY